jgi:hypothetical protein
MLLHFPNSWEKKKRLLFAQPLFRFKPARLPFRLGKTQGLQGNV